ncbi:protein ecdysoneless [Dendroctonus ponderosae]|uniref:Uncharacterized protein n=1 Tax=Dendroctonus ponderosae TaxID=77166 RepID=U4UJW1_DENPD|nr:protein ecdysoneless [Dendroctonus ponderosae]XP_048525906.1 protein ecdysoneless [Dendroctonus ponderosae]ERL94349.1 hypothetical protein D910_11630 [Dendroctonus ponderosae]KAH1008677.1 hypothetical protein HUJ05_009212 [Dendroctonus ponderosae]
MNKQQDPLQTIREDDFVQYYLFPRIEASDESLQEKLLEAVLAKADRVLERFAQNYLWHKDQIRFVPMTESSNFLTRVDGEEERLPPHLFGVSHYGDNIQDEWFIVFLLQQITKEIPGVVARVFDSDGEFLLIEAADFLPNWANPESCTNRVYIYEGNIHLLPVDDKECVDISVEGALRKIWNEPHKSRSHPDVQNSIQNRLLFSPESMRENFHHATVLVPTAVAAILKKKPNLISAAVQAFCNRDTVDMRACRAMKYFPPEQRVKTRIKFTRCLYAMLLHSKYIPDRKIGWNLPPATSNDYKQHLLGVKIACGFEILASQAKPNADVEGDRGWAQFLKRLNEIEYFKGLLEGSKEYNTRFNKAKVYYTEHRTSLHSGSNVGQEVLQLLRSCDIDYDELCKEAQNNAVKDDDESWLDISPEELDQMLQERYGQKKMFKVTESSDASNFAQKVNSFLNHISDVDGAEFPSGDAKNGDTPERPPRRKKTASEKTVSFSQNISEQKRVDFDPDSFASAIQNILNFVIPEDESWNLESDSDMSEYETDEFVKESDLNETEAKNKMQKYMQEMDEQLASTTIGQSFERNSADNGFEDIENFKAVDIDVNALKNILKSYRSELGEAGPSSTMLGPMGVHIESNHE